MIGRETAEKLLAVARRARDRIALKVDAGLDKTEESKREFAYLEILVREAHVEMRQGLDYDVLDLAARVVCRVAKEGDPVELVDVIANLERVVREQGELAKRGMPPTSAVQVDIGLKPEGLASADPFPGLVKDFVRHAGRHPGLGLPYGQAACQKCRGTGSVVVDLGEPRVRTMQPCPCTIK